jgi:hypothetical protein
VKIILIVLLALIIAQSALSAPNITIQASQRTLTYVFRPAGPNIPWRDLELTTIVIDEYLSGPKAVVVQINTNGTRKRSFPVAKAQFNKLWAMFKASGVNNYPVKDTKGIDIDGCYFIIAGQKFYAVPRNKASSTLVSLATELRTYAK